MIKLKIEFFDRVSQSGETGFRSAEIQIPDEAMLLSNKPTFNGEISNERHQFVMDELERIVNETEGVNYGEISEIESDIPIRQRFVIITCRKIQ